ncbi:Excinuclease ABC subunit C [hydrothermal vent metagenome]|uniref:UvrABC system protein C n=1 Tax=hydrothermal vent metagenome TaxID=652676 RepID=A0A3B0YNS0_9ZZZZ
MMTAKFKHDIKLFLQKLPQLPGVYRMLDEEEQVLYVGKARNLNQRVKNYFRQEGQGTKQQALMSHTVDIELAITHTEGEALILENNLIKTHKPRYNILLRDDKSYPYIFASTEHDFPRLSFYRGAKKMKGQYFGPYPSAGAVRQTLKLIQKLFPVRQCEDSFFKNRSRPCLQYQIKRCTAPCTELISKEGYAQHVKHAILFLQGRTDDVINDMAAKMEQASDTQDYETAATMRDHIQNLRKLTEQQYVDNEGGDLDIVAVQVLGGQACVQVFFIRGGRNLGNKIFFPKIHKLDDTQSVIQEFISQYYSEKFIPPEIISSHMPADTELLQNALSEQSAHKVVIKHNVRAIRAQWLKLAIHNAEHSLKTHLTSKAGMHKRLLELTEVLGLAECPERMECFDISHTMGEATVASCVVFGTEGPLKSDYRRFNITGITGGDDYAAMQQAIERRYTRLVKGEGRIPDLLVIDGGKGQISKVMEALNEIQVDGVQVIGVAKGPDRRPGQERIFLSNQRTPIILPEESAALHLIQQIRDEAHRFAITGHRHRRAKKRTTSILEEIPGMGPKRRQLLLTRFGGLQQVKRAGVDDLASVDGISKELAQKIYNTFHPLAE